MRPRYLITGGNGQLGLEFARFFSVQNLDYRAVDLEHCDLSRIDLLEPLMAEFKPSVVINCAAYNQVDLAENHPLALYQGNVIAIANLIAQCRRHGCLLVHFSSDYVFPGTGRIPLTETDIPAPGNIYGRSKLLGEQLVQAGEIEYLLFRVSWLYGQGIQNFIYKLKQWAEKQDVLKIASDETSIPVWTGLAVEMTMLAMERELRGLYHLTPSGFCSRLEWAREIGRLCGMKTTMLPVERSFFNLPALRPEFSALSNKKLQTDLGYRIGSWQDYLSEFLGRDR